MKLFSLAAAAVLLFSFPLRATEKAAPKPVKPSPQAAAAPQDIKVTADPSKVPQNAKPADLQDKRLLVGEEKAAGDAYQFERLGVTAAGQGQLDQAREFFRKSWELGELPTAPFNMACLDVREGKIDEAFKQLDRAVSAGMDDEEILMNDTDLASIRGRSEFGRVLAGIRKNREDGDAAVIKEGVFVAPQSKVRAILLLIHDKSSDPLTVSGPFMDEALARGLSVAVPRGPARVGKKRFGWGDSNRAIRASQVSIDEARKRAGRADLPLIVLGIGRGGVLAYSLVVRNPGVFAAVGSLGGPFTPGTEKLSQREVKEGLRGVRLVFGIPQDAKEPGLVTAMRKGKDALQAIGFAPVLLEWPGSGNTLPADVPKAVRDTLDALIRKPS